jgi:hypothetical protein
VHAAQLLIVVILLGLDAYGIRFVAYGDLVYALFVVSTVRLSNTSYSTAHSCSPYVPSQSAHTSSHVSPYSRGSITPELS